MTYEEGIMGIPAQFEYKPEIIGKENIKPFKRVIVLGMGGSRLGADILKMISPESEIHIHSDFDLPKLSDAVLKESLVIANSYSGDTAETISGANMARERGLNLVIVTGGGELLDMATSYDIPHVIIPHDEMPARIDVGFDIMALTALIGLDSNLFKSCADINPMALEEQGKKLAGQLRSAIPLIYTSNRFNELGYIWKVILNETGKMPAFHNRFPEVDHNEIAGFERLNPTAGVHAVMIKDASDSRVIRRMDAFTRLLLSRNIPVSALTILTASVAEQVMSSLILAHWTADELAHAAGADPLATPIIEEFKKEIVD